jgi:hypothetical protein
MRTLAVTAVTAAAVAVVTVVTVAAVTVAVAVAVALYGAVQGSYSSCRVRPPQHPGALERSHDVE